MQKFIINEKLLDALDEYDKRSLLMQQHGSLGLPYEGNLYEDVNDDLIYHVPIYDTAHRRFAAFCAFTEAVWYKEKDIRRIISRTFWVHTVSVISGLWILY